MRECMLIVVLLMLTSGSRAQQPTTAPAAAEMSAAVTAFMKPIEAASGDDPIRAKLKERHNTAVRLLEVKVEGYHKGLNDVSKVFEVAQIVGQAKLDLAQQGKERDQVFEQLLKVTQNFENRLNDQFEKGLASEADVLRARLARQAVEIELLKPGRSGAAPTTQPR